jgi:Sap, sulfolipid-1-addressing protein
MLHALFQTLLYALLASFSALALGAALAAMQAGRLKALVFAASFVTGQLFTCAVFVLVGGAAIGTRRDLPELHAVLELLAAAALIVLAFRVRARGPIERRAPSMRGRALLERLGRLRLMTMVLAGVLLGIGGPKRLLLTGFAATVIATAGVGDGAQSALVVWYVAVATMIVWAPVILFVLVGDRVVAFVTRAQQRVARRQQEVTVVALLVLAAFLVLDAISTL